MRYLKIGLLLIGGLWGTLAMATLSKGGGITNTDGSINADAVIRKAFDNWRGSTASYAVIRMVITKLDRVDSLKFNSWTKGEEHSITVFTEPSRDKGQGLLMINDNLWTYTPRSGRSIKIASSMKSNSWMGSDLSYDDISRTSDQLKYYTNTLVTTTKADNGMKVYIIDSIPKPNAPVVWGREQGAYREDFAMLWREFYDQGGKKVRRFETEQITNIAGHMYPMLIRVRNLEKPGTKTEMITDSVDFGVQLDDSFFSLYTLEKANKQ